MPRAALSSRFSLTSRSVALSSNWLQTLVDSTTPFAGLMFKGVPGAIVVAYNFDSAFGGVPLAERPTLIVEHHASEVIPEPPTVILFIIGFALAAFRRTRFQFRSVKGVI